MEEKIGLWVMEIFFSLCVLLTLLPIFRPEIIVNLTAKWFKWVIKMYGFEVEIKPTLRAKVICRMWNLIMFCIFVLLLIILPNTLK